MSGCTAANFSSAKSRNVPSGITNAETNRCTGFVGCEMWIEMATFSFDTLQSEGWT